MLGLAMCGIGDKLTGRIFIIAADKIAEQMFTLTPEKVLGGDLQSAQTKKISLNLRYI